MTHQVTVLSTDIRDATEIELIEDEHNSMKTNIQVDNLLIVYDRTWRDTITTTGS